MTSRHFASRGAIFLLGCAILATVAAAQFPRAPKPFEPKMPQGVGGCTINKPCAEVAPDIIKKALGPSPLESNLRQLTDVVGGRVTGSPAADKAIDWAVQAFRAAGVDEVLTENFTVPVGWSEGRTRLEILAPEPFPVHLVSVGWSPSTSPGGLTGNVIDVGTGDETGFKHAGDSVKGAIVLVHTNVLKTWDDLMNEYYFEPAIIDRAVNAGAAAIFWMSTRPYMLLYRHNLSLTGELERLPQAVLAREDALRIARFIAASQPVKVHLDMPNKITERAPSENVVAEIRGSEKPDEFVILGAHLDSWELGTGALDNGCNAALVIDSLRAIKASGLTPRRTIRFILFAGEEEGMTGSFSYVRAHRAELDKAAGVVVFDSGIGRVTGFSVGGRKDAVGATKEILAPLAQLNATGVTTDADWGTDNFDFLLEGVPTLVANQEEGNYLINYHASSDTFDKVDVAQLKKHTAEAAWVTYALADSPDRIGPRLNHAEIEQTLHETHMDDQLKPTTLWQQWQSGKRGRAN